MIEDTKDKIRRNLIALSVMIIVSKVLDISIAKTLFKLIGAGEVTYENKAKIQIITSCIWVYFFYRFWALDDTKSSWSKLKEGFKDRLVDLKNKDIRKITGDYILSNKSRLGTAYFFSYENDNRKTLDLNFSKENFDGKKNYDITTVRGLTSSFELVERVKITLPYSDKNINASYSVFNKSSLHPSRNIENDSIQLEVYIHTEFNKKANVYRGIKATLLMIFSENCSDFIFGNLIAIAGFITIFV